MKIISVILMVLVVAVLATGTIFESVKGAEWVADHFYTAWWFVVLMALVAVGAIVAIVQGKMWHKPSTLLIHASVPVILLGGALTTWTGEKGSMLMLPFTPNHTVNDNHGQLWELPFSLTMTRFEIVTYPGTHTPMDFVTHVTVSDGSPLRKETISMNHILRHRGYRFYQEDYGDDGSSTLSVSHDPWGIGVTYCGYALLIIGLLWLMVAKNERFRQLLRKAAPLLLMLIFNFQFSIFNPANAQPPTLPKGTADEMGRMFVLYKGRVCPLQTYAKDFTTKLTGKATYRGLTSEQVLSGYLFYFGDWADEPAIKGQSYAELSYLDSVRISPTTDKKTRQASERYNLVRTLLSGKGLKLFPLSDSTGALGWYAQNDMLPLSVDDSAYLFVRKQQAYCQELVVKRDFEELERVFAKTRRFQEREAAGDVLPSAFREGAERLYNALTAGRWLAMVSITLGFLFFAYTLIRKNKQAKWMRVASIVWVVALTTFLLLIFILRWIVGGHAPMAGGFDTMNLMALVTGMVALMLCRRHGVALPAGMLAMGLCLLVAMMSGSNPPVTNLMPVLNSPLLTLHVAVIMCSYALFFFVAMFALAGLIMGKRGNSNIQFSIFNLELLLLYPAVTLLALGIIIGAVWANISWGNYWSWDPKEVWALITLIVYALPLHGGLLRRAGVFHLYCLLAFLSVVVTYFGVNVFLGGMHSYM